MDFCECGCGRPIKQPKYGKRVRFVMGHQHHKPHTERTEKECSRCKTIKPLTEYYTRKDGWDGYQVWCKACMIELSRAKTLENSEKSQEYWKRYRESHREVAIQRNREYRAKHKDRVRVALKLQWAIQSGKMPPAKELTCKACGKPAQDYHHPDYSKPLEVVPLCKSCHRRIHGAGL